MLRARGDRHTASRLLPGKMAHSNWVIRGNLRTEAVYKG